MANPGIETQAQEGRDLTSRVVNSVRASLREHTLRYAENKNRIS